MNGVVSGRFWRILVKGLTQVQLGGCFVVAALLLLPAVSSSAGFLVFFMDLSKSRPLRCHQSQTKEGLIYDFTFYSPKGKGLQVGTSAFYLALSQSRIRITASNAREPSGGVEPMLLCWCEWTDESVNLSADVCH